jgi:hypothetical protein
MILMDSKLNDFQIVSNLHDLPDNLINEMYFDFKSIFPRWNKNTLKEHLSLHPKKFCGVIFNGKIVAFSSYVSQKSSKSNSMLDCELREFAAIHSRKFQQQSISVLKNGKLTPGLFLLKHLSKNHSAFSGEFRRTIDTLVSKLEKLGAVKRIPGSIDKYLILSNFKKIETINFNKSLQIQKTNNSLRNQKPLNSNRFKLKKLFNGLKKRIFSRK